MSTLGTMGIAKLDCNPDIAFIIPCTVANVLRSQNNAMYEYYACHGEVQNAIAMSHEGCIEKCCTTSTTAYNPYHGHRKKTISKPHMYRALPAEHDARARRS